MKRIASALVFFSICLLITGTAFSRTASDRPIRVGWLQNDIHHLPLLVAIEKGFFNELGLNVVIEGTFRAGPEVMSAFSAGALDLAYVGEAPTVTAVANGTAQVVILAQVNTEGSAIVVGKDSPITDVAGLQGKHIAVPGYSTVQDFLLRKACGHAGSDRNGAKVTVIKPPEMMGALRTRQIDGFIAWEPYPSQAVKAGVGKTLVSSGKIWQNHPCCVLVAEKRFAQTSKADMEKIMKAHEKSIEFIKGNRDESVRIAAKYTGLDEETLKNAMNAVTYVSALNIEGLKEYVTFLKGLGYINTDDVESFVEKIVYHR